jgi:hypothetical protein
MPGPRGEDCRLCYYSADYDECRFSLAMIRMTGVETSRCIPIKQTGCG